MQQAKFRLNKDYATQKYATKITNVCENLVLDVFMNAKSHS